VTVESGDWLVFRPKAVQPKAGLILYPGALVDYRAYSWEARAIASKGYLVVVVPMPLNLAVLGSDRARGPIAAFPEVGKWAVGGHSLGGAMASSFASKSDRLVGGLVLWAAYPGDSDDLSGLDLAVTTIYATDDGLATPDKIAASRARLPASTVWVEIAGGNHAQFGSYGRQSGDGVASIDESAQQEIVVSATVSLLERIAAR
jgi:hypothetical protein